MAKIREGFVSNSSTSSFCIFGIEIECDALIELLGLEMGRKPNCRHEFDRETIKFCPECGGSAWRKNSPNWEDINKACL